MKKLAVLLLTLVLLTGCGKEPPEQTTAPTAQTTEPTAPILQATKPTAPEFTDPEPTTKTIYIRTASTSASDGAVARTEYLFDENMLLKEVVVYTNGVETRRHTVENDENGNYIRWTSDGSRIEYSYDHQGNPLGYATYMGEMLISQTVYTWENGRQTSVTTRMTVQALEHRTVLTYNESGYLVRLDHYDGATLSSYCLYTLGADGRPSAMTSYLASGALEQNVTYAYEGNITTGTVTGADGAVIQYTEEMTDEHGNLLSTTTYDADGNMLTQETNTWTALEVPLDSLRAPI